MSSNLQRVALRPTSCRSHRPGNPHDLEQIGLARGFVAHGVLADIAIEAGEDSERRADRFLTSQMPGKLNAAGPDWIDARHRRSWPGDTVSGQPSNVPSSRPTSEHARGAVPRCVLESPRNHRRHGVGSLGAVPPFVLGLSRNHQRRGSRFLRLFVLGGCRHHSATRPRWLRPDRRNRSGKSSSGRQAAPPVSRQRFRHEASSR